MRTKISRHHILSLIIALYCLSGCSTLSLSYNHADWIALWKIDQYFDISYEQGASLKPRLVNLHDWHRQQELPLYVEFLQEISDQWQDGFTVDEIQWIFHRYRSLRDRLTVRIVSQGSPFLVTLDRTQVRYFQSVIDDENRDLLQEIGETPEERLARRTEKTLRWLRDWVGDLHPDQEFAVAQLIKRSPDTTSSWLRNRYNRQRQFIALLQTEGNPKRIEQTIRPWLIDPDAETASRKEVQEFGRRMHAFQTFVLEIDRMLIVEQRQHGLAKLQALIREIESLVTTQP